MSTGAALEVARLHAVLAGRPFSPVVHVYAGPLSPSGRFTRRVTRPVCSARTRKLTVAPRRGVVVDVQARRVCARCSARLSALARRAEQPPVNTELEKAYWEAADVTSIDLVTALVVASSVAETHAISHVTNLLFGQVSTTANRRPAEPGKAQSRWDFEKQLLARRTELRNAERTPEQIEAAARAREDSAARDARILAQRAKDARVNRAMDRRLAQKYEMPHEKALLDNST